MINIKIDISNATLKLFLFFFPFGFVSFRFIFNKLHGDRKLHAYEFEYTNIQLFRPEANSV